MSKKVNHEHLLGELLAVMHGDGGHYVNDYGWEKATQDALREWYRRGYEIDRLQMQLEVAHKYYQTKPKTSLGRKVRKVVGFVFRWVSMFIIFWLMLYLILAVLYLIG